MVLIILVLLVFNIAECQIIVNTSNGRIQGTKLATKFGSNLEAFLGIPYAVPPLGALRFEKPVPASKWTEVYQANKPPYRCSQSEVGEENCLFLNVYAPEGASGNTSKKRPVAIWIHGGGFVSGYGGKHHDSKMFIARSQSVFVTFNYRLGAFGFLNCGTPTGNMGLYDQLLVFQWVKENIENFGGDPNRVTLIGYSAGAASIHYHLLSPISEGLFHQAILLSGSANAPWAFQSKDVAHDRCSDLLKSLKCLSNDTLTCLKGKSKEEITEASSGLFVEPVTFTFVPTIDGEIVTSEPEQTDFRKGSIPIMTVSNEDEGSIFIYLYFALEMFEEQKSLKSKHFETALRSMMTEYSRSDQSEIIKGYTIGRNMNDQNIVTSVVSNFISDKYFICPLLEAMQKRAEEEEVFYYHFVHQHEKSSSYEPWLGVRHNSFLKFFLGTPLAKKQDYSDKEIETVNRILDKFINFIHKG